MSDVLLVIVIVVACALVVYCIVDVVRADAVRYLPKWLWAVFCLNAVGCIAYLIFGKSRTPTETHA